MTKEEAIELLEDLYGAIEDNQGRDYDEAFRMAIEALSTKAVQGVGRYENAMQKLREMPKYFNGIKAKQIKKVSPEAVQGEWIFNPTDAIDLMFAKPKCSKCGFESSDGGNFCSNCGARMKGGDNK